MELSVFERLMLLNVLPAKGDITTIRIRRELRENLSFSEEEHERLKFTNDDEGIHWEAGVDIVKEVDIGEKAKEVIVKEMDALAEAGQFTEDHLDIYDRFTK